MISDRSKKKKKKNLNLWAYDDIPVNCVLREQSHVQMFAIKLEARNSLERHNMLKRLRFVLMEIIKKYSNLFIRMGAPILLAI